MTRHILLSLFAGAALLVGPSAGAAEPLNQLNLDDLCRYTDRDTSRPSARRLWARWVPSIRLRARWYPDRDTDDRIEQRGQPLVPFSSRLLEHDSLRHRAELAAFWDVADLFRPLDRTDRDRLTEQQTRCRYQLRRRQRRAITGPAGREGQTTDANEGTDDFFPADQ